MIKIDFSFYMALILALLFGQIDVYLTYLIALLIHECGHLIIATFFKWEIATLKISAIGGFLKFNDDLVKPPIQTLAVASMGIIFNLILGIILHLTNGPASLTYAQFAIALFNMLPITPLDGSKILQAILRLFLPFNAVLKVLKTTNIICLMIFVLGILSLDLQQYFLVAIMLAIFVGRFGCENAYIYERYKIQKETLVS